LEFVISAAKWLHNIRFLAVSGEGAVAPALFIDGNFTSGQTRWRQKVRGFQLLKTETTEEAAGPTIKIPADTNPKIAPYASLSSHKPLGIALFPTAAGDPTSETGSLVTASSSRESRANLNPQPRHNIIAEVDMDSSESPTYGAQEGSAYNGHFGPFPRPL
jgi:hypothetical protein